MTKKRKKVHKSIKFWTNINFSKHKVGQLSETQYTLTICEKTHNLRPTEKKIIEFP